MYKSETQIITLYSIFPFVVPHVWPWARYTRTTNRST